ncbi:TetR family transcriptional regulator [Mangrovibacter sp. MFB070]|uniref:TetR/AcrR family transcriptional regulator n=1 Tax=Mangrovibacter sp. MFB070 TaxID=1224318 RepID=UPI0004D89974|nr:TetR/AcrR family transcriptional regulator [Mangrovibacter sp. MFB070]KEA51097.1 TetR family transcriptional regulator [Mangrovibacter sp. MFB070]
MGRVSKEQMELNRENIIKTSAELFRKHGLDGVSVNDIMAAVGLTHGGFYGHFSSKDELEAVACQRAFEESGATFSASGITTFDEFVDYYLSSEHRDCAGSGCAVTALASDVLRKSPEKPVREIYREGVKKMASRLATIQGAEPNARPSDKQLAQLAMLTGALILSRATESDDLSERFLLATKKYLHELEQQE